MPERELKFLADEDFSLDGVDVGRKHRLGAPGEARYETIYVDTADLRLAGWGCSLRHRSGEGWTLKLPPSTSEALLERDEIPFPDPAGGSRPEPPEEALRLVTAFVRTAGVRPVARLRTTRQSRDLEDLEGTAVAEVTLDDVRVLGRQPWSFREVEVELAPGTPASLADRMGRRFKAAGVKAERTPKYLRALGDRAPGAPEVAAVDVDGSATPAELVRAAFGRSVGKLLLNDAVMRVADDDEAVHQARVAVRRLRSNLRAFGPYLERAWVVQLRSELKWLGGLLGGLRDAHVMQARLQARIEAMPGGAERAVDVLAALENRRRRTRRELLAGLDEPRYVELLDRLVAAYKEPALATDGALIGGALVQAVLVPPAGRIRTSVGQLGEHPPDEALHEVRIDAKGLRYAAEAVEPVAGRAVARLERAARQVQDVLGEHQDAVVAATWLRARAARAIPAAPWRALERIEIEAADAARAEWPEAWARLEQAMTEAGL
jgi:CHAD domain-containing protein